MIHLRCIGWAAACALLGFAAVAWAQQADPATAVVQGDPMSELLVRLVSGGGLPAVLAFLGWQLRGQIGHGVPVVISLNADDRALVKRLVRALERDDDTPAPP